METKSAQPERLRAVTLIFRFPAGLGTLRIHAGCRASSGLFPQPLLISCYSVVVKLVYHRFLAKSTIFRCAVQTVCTKVGQMRQRVWFWRRAFPIRGRWPRPRPRPDEGKALLAAHRRVVASTRPSSVTFGDSFPLRGGKPFSLSPVQHAGQRLVNQEAERRVQQTFKQGKREVEGDQAGQQAVHAGVDGLVHTDDGLERQMI